MNAHNDNDNDNDSDNNNDVTARLKRGFASAAAAPDLSPELVDGASERTAPRLVNPSRNRVVAGGFSVAVAAVAATALVVTSPFQSAPLFTAAANGGATSMSASAEGGASDKMMAQWVNYEYVAGASLSTASGNGNVYQLVRTGNATDTLNGIARVFGVDGTATTSEYSDPAYPTYVVGSEDGTEPSVTITWSGTGNWWFNNPNAYPPPVCVAAPDQEPSSTGENTLVDPLVCEVADIAVGESRAPGKGEAATLASSLFAQTGLDVAASDIAVTVDDWQTTATGNLTVDGTQTAIDWSVSWAPSGEISWAYGHSVEVVDRGNFGTVSATEAVTRLADWRWYGSAGPDYQGGMIAFASDSMVRSEGVTAVDPAEPAVGPVEPAQPANPANPANPSEEPAVNPGDEPTDGATAEPTPIPEETVSPEPLPEPLLEPETVVVTVDNAEATLVMMWDANGDVWLVPGFAMQHPEGWWNTVVSLVEGVIALPELAEG